MNSLLASDLALKFWGWILYPCATSPPKADEEQGIFHVPILAKREEIKHRTSKRPQGPHGWTENSFFCSFFTGKGVVWEEDDLQCFRGFVELSIGNVVLLSLISTFKSLQRVVGIKNSLRS